MTDIIELMQAVS